MIDLCLGESNFTVRIKALQTKQVPFPDRPEPAEKVLLVTETPEGRVYNVDEVWIKIKENQKSCGLWITLDSKGKILTTSTLGRFLRFMKVTSLQELINKDITLSPKDNNFMAAIGY
jgi:hypothetical protein